MSVFFDPTRGGFIHDDIISIIPAQAIQLTQAQYQGFLDDISAGKVPTVSNGQVVMQDPVITVTWDDIRKRRDFLLQMSDWSQLPDAPLSTDQKAAWASYRQTLRNLPDTSPDPNSVSWPAQPTPTT